MSVPTCCDDLRTAQRLGIATETCRGHAFKTTDEVRRQLVTLNYCPFCGTELRPIAERNTDLQG